METFQRPNFFNTSVGGINKLNSTQTLDQLKILQLQGQHNKFSNSDQKNKLHLFNDLMKSRIGKELDESMVSQFEKIPETYNPLYDWKDKHGLIGDTRSRYDVHYLHIDSSDRQIQPIMEIAEYYSLSDNPILTTELSNKIFINHPEHPFQVEDKITIDGLAPSVYKLRVDPSQNILPISFVSGQSCMAINFAHGIPEIHKAASELNNLFIQISEFTNVGSSGNASYYGNITITFINDVHKFFLEDASRGLLYSPDMMYVELPYTYDTSPGTPTTLASYFNISLYYINGIPMNSINAQYPTDIYHNSYYQIIREVTSNGYYINLGSNALASGYIGGKSIRIGQISDFSGGFPEPNHYILPLERIYKNVISVRLLSTEFPNSEYVVKNYPTTSQNNKIYWQNYEDGAYIYSVEIPPGKYTPTSLISILESKFYDTQRVYYPSVTQNYTNHSYMQISINTDTDTSTISSFKETILSRAFANMYYVLTDPTHTPLPWDHTFVPVASTSAGDPVITQNDPSQLYPIFILVQYDNHGLKLNTMYETHVAGQEYVPNGTSGDMLIITGTTTYKGVPSAKIDGTYEAFAPNLELGYDKLNYFMIKLQPLDIGQYTKRDEAQKGGIFYIYTPNLFRLLFNYSDTIGKLLGFPNVGETYAVTKYASSISNKDPYQPDISPAQLADATTPGNAVMLCGYNYILMECMELPVVESLGKVKDAFSKILLVGVPGKICFNTFVCTPKIFYEPIQELSQLTLSFYAPGGELYDFNGLDHSFTLEITTLDELPNDTHVNTHTGKTL